MQIETTRFGCVEMSEQDLIHFDGGIIGFPRERSFALIPHAGSNAIAWLQSATTPELAFPVVSAHGLVADYPDVPLSRAAEKAGILGDPDRLAALAVLSAPTNQPATVNLLAPVLIDSTTRRGAQVFLEGSRFTTRELFVTPPQPVCADEAPDQAAAGEASVSADESVEAR
jgi:flagellar assembly factor FliW